MLHERAWIKSDVFQVAVKVVCETRDKAQSLALEQKLRDTYQMLSWNLPGIKCCLGIYLPYKSYKSYNGPQQL